jgi:hypothetical protein
MARFKMFGRGVSLQIAIMVACEMAFILFGMFSPNETSTAYGCRL